MPTQTSLPVNMPNANNNITKSNTGNNWKNTKLNTPPVTKFIAPSNYRPDHNKQTNLAYYQKETETYLDGNAFRARPIKHWRKQYVNTNSRQTGTNRYLLSQINTPGGLVATQNTDCDCSGVIVYGDYNLGAINKVGKYNPINTDTDPQNNITGKCLNLCDPPSHARKKIQYPSLVNANPDLPKFYQSNAEYLRARCKNYTKKSFNFQADSLYSQSNAYNANCIDSDCKLTYYKPNNAQYAQQGAVDSSSRLLRLKLNTINKAANSAKNVFELGNASANALTYGSNTETPFVTKSKYQSSQFYNNYYKYRSGGTGNHVSSGCFCDGDKITQTQRQFKKVRTNGVGPRTCCGTV